MNDENQKLITEKEWYECKKSTRLMDFLYSVNYDKKVLWRLSLDFIRHTAFENRTAWDLLPDMSRQCVRDVESYIYGEGSENKLLEARENARYAMQIIEVDENTLPIYTASFAVFRLTFNAGVSVADNVAFAIVHTLPEFINWHEGMAKVASSVPPKMWKEYWLKIYDQCHSMQAEIIRQEITWDSVQSAIALERWS